MLIDTILKDKGNTVETISDSLTLLEAAKMLDQKRIGAIVAVDDSGELCGVLSERDIVRRFARNGEKTVDMIGTFNVEHIKMRQVDDAAVVAQRELFGIGNTPEVAVVPFRLADRHLVTVFLQKVFVGRITMAA